MKDDHDLPYTPTTYPKRRARAALVVRVVTIAAMLAALILCGVALNRIPRPSTGARVVPTLTPPPAATGGVR